MTTGDTTPESAPNGRNRSGYRTMNTIEVDGMVFDRVNFHSTKGGFKMKPGQRRVDFEDLITCPVCTQDKPVEAFTAREISHIARHVKQYEASPDTPEKRASA